jgi:lipopolysaccharide transport system permease protein
MLLFLLMMMYFYFFPQTNATFHFTYAVLSVPFLVVLMALLGLGIGLIITAMTTKYKDLTFSLYLNQY